MVVTALAAAGLALPAAPAAAVTGSALYTVRSTMPEWRDEATAVLSCGPDTLYAIGASDTGNGFVVIDQLEPTTTGTATVHAHEGATAAPSSWTLTGVAVCGPTPPGGVSLVSVPSAPATVSGTTESTFQGATCSSGVPLGGGYRVNTNPVDAGKAVVTKLIPSSTGYTVTAYADAASTSYGWTTSTSVVCGGLSTTAFPGQPAPVVSANSTVSPKAEDVACGSAQGHIGLGFALSSRDATTVPTEILPTVNLLGTIDRAVAGASAGPAGNPNPWNLSVYVRCAFL